MKILIVGAGATGGFFGAHLTRAGRDVSFLVRPARADQLGQGLSILTADHADDSPAQVLTVPVRAITSTEGDDPHDLVILAVKAWSLPQVVPQLAPAIGPQTLVLPLLNGMAHVQQLDDAFGNDRVLGALVRVVASLTPEGAVRQFQPGATMAVGPRTSAGPARSRLQEVRAALTVPGFDLAMDPHITSAMWHKWAFITAAGVITCLMRGPVGAVVAAPGGADFALRVIAETEQVAAAAGHPVPDHERAVTAAMLTAPGSPFTSSLYRDVLAGNQHEGEHLLGAFATAAAGWAVPTPLLDLALLQLRTHDHDG